MPVISERENLLLSEGNRRTNVPTTGIHWLIAACFVVGSTAGAGFLSLPIAVDRTGIVGFVVFLSIWASCLYTSKQLSDETRDERTCYSYADLAERAYQGGAYARLTIVIFLDVLYLGASVVYLLLASENANKLNSDIVPCEWVLILGAIMTVGVVVCRNPGDPWFQFITFLSTSLTLISSIMLCVIITQYRDDEPVSHSNITFPYFTAGLSTMVFACGGHPAFPTIQATMEHREHFSWSLYLGFAVILILYLPNMITSYVIQGNRAPNNILQELGTDNFASKLVTGLMIGHLLLSICIIMNPICQEFERMCGTQGGWSVRSAICRTFLMAIVVIVAMLVPHFDILLTLIGSALVTWLAFVFPPIFYLRMRGVYDVSLSRRFVHYGIVFAGFVSMVVLSVGSVMYITKEKRFLDPCFTNFTEIL